MADDVFDYVVVGSGSSGSVIASRLIARNAGTVLLLEAGEKDSSVYFKMPGALSKVIPTRTWAYMADPEPATGNRPMTIAQGKVIGGSSSVNGMVYIRGQAQDYEEWEHDLGCAGWGADEMLRYFKKAERNESLADAHHGTEGMLPVSDNRYRHPLSMAFVRAGQEIGLPYVTDFNGARQDGVGWYQTTTFNGTRASVASTYLKAVRGNANLAIRHNVLVERVLIEEDRATGVVYSQGDQSRTVTARAEVIMCAGAIGSAKIMMLSGIGPTDHLGSVGVRPIRDLPVGRNFHDHLHMSVNATTLAASSLYGQDKGIKAALNGAQWLMFKTGLLSSNLLEAGCFVDTANEGRPDVQIHFLPVLDSWDDPDGIHVGRTHGYTLKVGHLRPKARGEVTLRSADPVDLPRIRANYLGHEDDLAGQVRAVELGLKFLSAPSFRRITGEIFSPTPQQSASRGELERFVRRGCKTTYHPVGTCRIGTDPRESVVDLELRVHGIRGLRVADSSVFPSVTSGNTNAPTIALAEKAADLILGNR